GERTERGERSGRWRRRERGGSRGADGRPSGGGAGRPHPDRRRARREAGGAAAGPGRDRLAHPRPGPPPEELTMAVLHHVNVNVPRGRSIAIASFYRDVFGFTMIERPDNGREGVWLDMGDGHQLHLSERDDPVPAQPHFALVVDDLPS